MDKRVMYLEDQLTNCLDNLELVTTQLTVMQNFLQKQFGSRFLDYAANQGLIIEKDFKVNNPRSIKMPRLSSPPQQQQIQRQSKLPPTRPVISDYLTMGDDEDDYMEGDEYNEGMGEVDSADPLAFVEIVEDPKLRSNNHQDADYDETEEHQFQSEETGYDQTNGQEFDNSDLVIVNCSGRTTLGNQNKRKHAQNGELLSINHQNPPRQTYSNRFQPRQRAVGRKRPVKANNATSSPVVPKLKIKLPLLHPKPDGQIAEDHSTLSQVLEDNSSSTAFASTSNALIANLGEEELPLVDTEDLREYYEVLEDKSVQCKICQKVLKAGWHKYARHYRTHTGEKPFACKVCGERFARKDNMHNHMKSKHEMRTRKQFLPRTNQNTEVLISECDEYANYFLSTDETS